MKRRLLLVLPVLAILAAAGFSWACWIGPGPTRTPVTILVPEGASIARVADQLKAAHAIRGDAGTFRGFARMFGARDPVRAGEFLIPPGMSASGILDLLQHGRPIQRHVTIPEGLPSVLVQERLAHIPWLTGPAPLPDEGSILPDTYSYRRGETRAAVVARMQAAMRRELARAWAGRRPGAAVATPEQAIILASIIEKETGKAAERRLVAAVYTNRLREGIRLDADPTVIYPVTRGRPLGRRILASELRADNGYNTYVRPGLPAGPITNPGRDSITAALDPAPSGALYMVADGTGGHAFADTLAQHNANVARWYAIRRARGEM
jgi:UPF0755 protein